MACANRHRGFDVWGQVDMMPRHLLYAGGENGGHTPLTRTMIEPGRGHGSVELQINRDTMPLIGAQVVSGWIEREPLLIVQAYNCLQLHTGQRKLVRLTCR